MLKLLTLPFLVLWLAAPGAPVEKEVPAAYRKMKNSLKPTAGLIDQARDIVYQQHCSYCHGAAGKGDGGKLEVSAGRAIPNFTTPEFAKHSDQWIFWRISEGVADTKMSAHKNVLSEKERWTLVLLVRSFNQKKAESRGKAKS